MGEKEEAKSDADINKKPLCDKLEEQTNGVKGAIKTFAGAVKKLGWTKYLKQVNESKTWIEQKAQQIEWMANPGLQVKDDTWKIMRSARNEAKDIFADLLFAKKKEVEGVAKQLPELEKYYPKLKPPDTEELN